MNGRLNMIATVVYRIQCILKAVLEFILLQMSKSNSCHIFDSDRIMAVKKREEGRMNFSMLLLGSNLFHSIITERKKKGLKKLFGFKIRNFIRISKV